jgi:hypothetical protein
MVDSAALRQRRKRAHRQGNHTLCRPDRCPLSGTIERDDMRSLRDAIETELRDDLPRLELARSLITVAARGGPAAVGALRELGQTIEAKRRGELTPAVAPRIDDEILELADHIVEMGLLRAFAAVEARAGEVGWEAAVGEYRRGHRDAAEFVAGQGRGVDFANRAAAAEVFGGSPAG